MGQGDGTSGTGRLYRRLKSWVHSYYDRKGGRVMENLDELIHEIEMNEWRKLGAQRAKEREEANK
jgi:hypothetical protein